MGEKQTLIKKHWNNIKTKMCNIVSFYTYRIIYKIAFVQALIIIYEIDSVYSALRSDATFFNYFGVVLSIVNILAIFAVIHSIKACEIEDSQNKINFASINSRSEDILLHGEKTKADYKLLVFDTGHAFVSKEINELFFDNDVIFSYCTRQDHFKSKVEQYIKNNHTNLRKILFCEYWNSQTGSKFFNEWKLCVNKIDFSAYKIYCHKGNYYDTFLTNIITGQKVLYEKDSNDIIASFDGRPHIQQYRDKDYLLSLEKTPFNNEIGISTLGFTNDKYFIFFRQNENAKSNKKEIVPTATGSGDNITLLRNKNEVDFKKILIQEMERELEEEASIVKEVPRLSKIFTILEMIWAKKKKKKKNPVRLETQLTGYFRWLEKGGKPEFIGITRIHCDKDRLKANLEEVNGFFTSPPILNFEDLEAFLEDPSNLLNDMAKPTPKPIPKPVSISVPMRMCIHCLKEQYHRHPEKILNLLGIGMDKIDAEYTSEEREEIG